MDAYLFKTSARLAEAKESLYAYIIEHGCDGLTKPHEERVFQSKFNDGSPLHAAMAHRFESIETGASAPAMAYLLTSIYRSEIAHGVTDHFDDRLVALGAMAPIAAAQKAPSEDSNAALPGRGWFWRRVWALLKIVICLAVLATTLLIFVEWNERRVARIQLVETTSSLDQSLARLAQELPPYYFACVTGKDGICSDPATTTNLAGLIEDSLRRFDQTLLVLERVQAASGTTAIFGVTSADECGNTSLAIVVLCQSRQRFFERRNCLRQRSEANSICANHTTLGIAGTRYEDMVGSDQPTVVNIFSRPVALFGEIEQLLDVSKSLREDPPFGPFGAFLQEWSNAVKRVIDWEHLYRNFRAPA